MRETGPSSCVMISSDARPSDSSWPLEPIFWTSPVLQVGISFVVEVVLSSIKEVCCSTAKLTCLKPQNVCRINERSRSDLL